MNPVALSYHLFHVAALVFVVAIFGFLIVVAVREQLERRRATRNPRPGFLYDRDKDRLGL